MTEILLVGGAEDSPTTPGSSSGHAAPTSEGGAATEDDPAGTCATLSTPNSAVLTAKGTQAHSSLDTKALGGFEPVDAGAAVQAATADRSFEPMPFRNARAAAEAMAKSTYSDAQASGAQVSDSALKDVLGRWAYKANRDRKHVTPHGAKSCLSETLGLVRTRTGRWQVSSSTKEAPQESKLLNLWLKQRLEQTGVSSSDSQPWLCSSITLNKNFASKCHRDKHNMGPSVIKAFGDHAGGGRSQVLAQR